MKAIKKIAVILAVGFSAALALLVVTALLIPPLLDNSSLGNKVRHEVSSLVNGDFNFDHFDLGLFPAPHLILSNAQISLPNKLSISVETVLLYPDIVAALLGRATLKNVSLNRPNAVFRLPAEAEKPGAQRPHLDLKQIMPALSKTRSGLQNLLSHIDDGTIHEGSIRIEHINSKPVTFDNFAATLNRVKDSVTIKAKTTSVAVAEIEVAGALHLHNGTGSAKIGLRSVDLAAVSDIVAPESSMRIESGVADIDLSLTGHKSKGAELDFSCTAPRIRLSGAGQPVDAEIIKLAGTVQISPASLSLTLADLHLGNPAMHLSGHTLISEKGPSIALQIEGRGIDVGATRSVLSALAGSNQVVQTVTEILKDGAIPSLTLSSTADTPDDLIGLKNLVLRTSLSKGELVIPGTDVTLTDVSGDVDITGGILTGQKIQARWRHSTLHEAKLLLNLKNKPLPLSLTATIDVDAADVSSILGTFIKDRVFRQALSKIKDLSGGATGTVSLSGDTGHISVAAAAHDIKFSARHHDLPSALQLTSGSITYKQNSVQLNDLVGSMGTATFDSLSGHVDLGKRKTFTITSGALRLVGKDLMPWLAAHRTTRDVARYYNGGQAVLRLTRVGVNGSLSDFAHADFSAAGSLEDLTIHKVPGLPGPLAITRLTFNADPQKILFSDVHTAILDGSLIVSGSYHGYMADDPQVLKLSFEGQTGSQVGKWMTDSAHLPTWLRLRPLTIGKSHFSYAKDDTSRISAKLSLQNDLEVDVKTEIAHSGITVDSLKIKDQRSEATATARLKDKILDLSFNGILHEETVQQIIHQPSLQNGSIKGSAKMSVNLEDPFHFSFLGKVSGQHLAGFAPYGLPAVIENISVRGDPGNVSIDSADLTIDDTAFRVSGNVMPKTGAMPAFRLEVEADSIDVDKIVKKISSQSRPQENKAPSGLLSSKIRGHINFKAARFMYHGHTIEPLQANLHLHDNIADLTLKETSLCGIVVQGTATLNNHDLSFHIKPTAQALKIETALDCLVGKKFKADGILDVTGAFDGHGSLPDLDFAKATTGQMEISVVDGHVYRDVIMLRLLKYLNFSQILTGQVSAEKMMEKGVGFDRFQARLKLQQGKLLYDHLILDGEEFSLVGTGKMDIIEKWLEFTLLVAPLKTLNTLLGDVPLVGGILQTIDTIPLGAKGAFNDIHFLPLAPGTVSTELQDVMKQTLGIPMNLIHLDVFTGQDKLDKR